MLSTAAAAVLNDVVTVERDNEIIARSRLGLGRFNPLVVSRTRFLVFPRFLEYDDTSNRPYTRRRGGDVVTGRASGCHQGVFSLLYETRKLVKRVIMLNGRAARSREDPFLLLLLLLPVLVSFACPFPLFLLLLVTVSLRLAGGPHAENRAISFTLRRHANSRIV